MLPGFAQASPYFLSACVGTAVKGGSAIADRSVGQGFSTLISIVAASTTRTPSFDSGILPAFTGTAFLMQKARLASCEAVFGSSARLTPSATSSAVTGAPSDQTWPLRSLNV